MSRSAMWVIGSIAAFLGVLALVISFIFEVTRRGQDTRHLPLITDHVISGIAHSNSANGKREECRWIDRRSDIQWASICATPIVDTYFGDETGRRFHANCGVDVRIEDQPFRRSREVQLLVLYEYDDFDDFRDRGFSEALDELEDGVETWEAYVAQPASNLTVDATRPPHPGTLRQFTLRINPTEIDFHQCEHANFLYLRGHFLHQFEWAEIR